MNNHKDPKVIIVPDNYTKALSLATKELGKADLLVEEQRFNPELFKELKEKGYPGDNIVMPRWRHPIPPTFKGAVHRRLSDARSMLILNSAIKANPNNPNRVAMLTEFGRLASRFENRIQSSMSGMNCEGEFGAFHKLALMLRVENWSQFRSALLDVEKNYDAFVDADFIPLESNSPESPFFRFQKAEKGQRAEKGVCYFRYVGDDVETPPRTQDIGSLQRTLRRKKIAIKVG